MNESMLFRALIVLGACQTVARFTPSLAAEPVTGPSADVQPQDSSTPTTAAHDVDDLRVTEQIRQALLADTTLSSLARRVGIATNPEAVILRGSVQPAEKERIDALAQQFAGARQIDDQLMVMDH
jgi:osmotically-inducible protein OsmY